VAGSQAASNVNAAMIRINFTRLISSTFGGWPQDFSGFACHRVFGRENHATHETDSFFLNFSDGVIRGCGQAA
jgi:hypothetical protein